MNSVQMGIGTAATRFKRVRLCQSAVPGLDSRPLCMLLLSCASLVTRSKVFSLYFPFCAGVCI